MSDDDQVTDLEAGVTNAGTDSVWMCRRLSDSIYAWACGQKADNEDDDPELSDRLIGWLVLFGFAYTILMVLARATSNSDTGNSSDDNAESDYLLPSVTGAMYLLVASTAHDLRAGVSLLVDGPCAGHRVFGIGLLVVYGIMMSAAMTVLVSTSDDSASVVLNAVAVLFIADLNCISPVDASRESPAGGLTVSYQTVRSDKSLASVHGGDNQDEKALKFLSTVSKQWRLFWAIESVGISFALAIVAIFYVGDASTLLEGNNIILKTFPTWFVWVTNPTAVTLCSVLLSSTLQAACDFCSASCQMADEPSFGGMVASAFDIFRVDMKKAQQRFGEDPCFFVALGMWLVHGVANLFFVLTTESGFPAVVLFITNISASPHTRLGFTKNILAFVYSNVVLVTGLAAKVLGVFRPAQEGVTTFLEPSYGSDVSGPRQRGSSRADSGTSSLLVGWGVGYWASSLLYVLGCSWHGGGCGWNDAPMVVTITSYGVIPCVVIAGIFMVADTNVLGTRFGGFIETAVKNLRDRRRVEYWIMASVMQDSIVVWIQFCDLLRSPFTYKPI